MTPLEIIFAIREGLKEYVDDTKYTNDYLMFIVDNKRTKYIRQEYNNIQRNVDEQLVQTIVLPLEEIDSSDMPSKYESEADTTRTIARVPLIVGLDHRTMIERIATVGKFERPINIVSRKRFIYSGSGDYDEDQIFGMIDGDRYLHLKSNKGEERAYEEISLGAVFERPMDQLNYDSANSTQDIRTFNYPLKKQTADIVILDIIRELANLKVLPTDQENNSADDSTILSNGQQQKR